MLAIIESDAGKVPESESGRGYGIGVLLSDISSTDERWVPTLVL